MKAVKIVLEIIAALAAVAGIVYVIATYGDKIVAWAKKLLNGKCCCQYDCDCDCDCDYDCDCEECECECECCCDEPAEVAEDTVIASDAEFEN